MNRETITRQWDHFLGLAQRQMSLGEIADAFGVDRGWLEREFGPDYRRAKAEGLGVMRNWLWEDATKGDKKAREALFKLTGLLDD